MKAHEDRRLDCTKLEQMGMSEPKASHCRGLSDPIKTLERTARKHDSRWQKFIISLTLVNLSDNGCESSWGTQNPTWRTAAMVSSSGPWNSPSTKSASHLLGSTRTQGM